MSCFRTCDVRGTYPAEVNEDLFRRIGQAVARRWAARAEVLIGHDCRIASRALHSALIHGLLEGGAKTVLDLGRVPTPLIYYGKRTLSVPVAMSVTASHNPPEHHGLKLLLPDGPAQSDDLAWLEANCPVDLPRRSGGSHRTIDLLSTYLGYLRSTWSEWGIQPSGRSPVDVVADAGNGAWSGIAPQFLRSLGIMCTAINDEPDGRFPGRSPDCSNPRNLTELAHRVRSQGAHIGLAWDGDGDRLAVVDDEGRSVSADALGLLLLPSFQAGSGRSILLDVKMSRVLQREIVARGFQPVIERSAHCSLERAMREHKCVFGCEYSGHYFFRELDGADDGLYAALHLCRAVARSGSLSEAVRRLPPIFITPDIRMSASREDSDTILAGIERAFPAATISRLDGVGVDLGEASFLLRRSVSEDKLTLRVEGNSPESLWRTVSTVAHLLPESLRPRVLDPNRWNLSGS